MRGAPQGTCVNAWGRADSGVEGVLCARWLRRWLRRWLLVAGCWPPALRSHVPPADDAGPRPRRPAQRASNIRVHPPKLEHDPAFSCEKKVTPQHLQPAPRPRNHILANMAGSPPPEEREKADAELKAKEAAEQAALPYKWTQTIKDVDVTISVDAKYKGRDLDIKFTKTTIKAGIKGQEPILEVSGRPMLALRSFRELTLVHRAYSRTRFTSMNPHGRSRRSRTARKSAFTSIK